MGCFKFPKGLTQKLETMIHKFWWGYSGDSQKINCVKWKCLCEAKENEGMGFKRIEVFNNALLTKQVWHMIHNPESL